MPILWGHAQYESVMFKQSTKRDPNGAAGCCYTDALKMSPWVSFTAQYMLFLYYYVSRGLD